MTITQEVVQVTPVIAEQWLGTMVHNRKLSTRNVDKFAEQMKDGLWIFDGSPIRFNETGNLIDGQHRLWALVEAGHEAQFLVLRGITQEAMATMDTGKSRTFTDILSLEDNDLAQLTTLAAVTNAVYRWEDGRRGSALSAGGAGTGGVVPNAVLLEFFRENRGRLIECCRMGANGTKRMRGLSGTSIGLAHWIFDAIDAADAEYFFTHLFDGVGLADGDAILALRNYLLRALAGSSTRAKLPLDLAIALMVKAWNAYREGGIVRQMTYRRGGASPEAFPVPK
jgi:hypothetical protein